MPQNIFCFTIMIDFKKRKNTHTPISENRVSERGENKEPAGKINLSKKLESKMMTLFEFGQMVLQFAAIHRTLF